MRKVFHEDWEDEGLEQMLIDFEISKDDVKDFDIIFASYLYEDYSGDAYVLMKSKVDNEYYEVHGGHCSCYGLEGQWDPEKADKDAIIHRIKNGTWGEEAKLKDHIADIFGV